MIETKDKRFNVFKSAKHFKFINCVEENSFSLNVHRNLKGRVTYNGKDFK